MKTVHLIAGARPNFMKVAPLWHALKQEAWCRPVLVHTGQHYDSLMSDVFFSDLGLPAPDYHLGVGSGTHAQQTAAVMVAYEQLCGTDVPDIVVVVGDVNSTMACTIAAKKLDLPVAHLEAGLRSFDRTMPEEINRLLTDVIADYLWTPSPDADENLIREGISPEKIERVGNIMIDSVVMMGPRIAEAGLPAKMGLPTRGYAVVTLHRPVNVDDRDALNVAFSAIEELSRQIPVVFPMHPRTKARATEFDLLTKLESSGRIRICQPFGYIDFMSLLSAAALVVTDSGGIQEETCYLGIPCLTVRESTERPATVSSGANRLVKFHDVPISAKSILSSQKAFQRTIPDLWDGKTASRIVQGLRQLFGL